MKLRIVLSILLTVTGTNSYAVVPFQLGDFISIAELGGLEVQKHELTYSQWDVLNAQLPKPNQSPWKAQNCYLKDLPGSIGPNFPAACVSYDDAKAFIDILNAQDSKFTYRLPTEIEAKALVEMTLNVLRRPSGGITLYQLARHAWYRSNSDYSDAGGHPHEVCTKNQVLGLCDVLGNLWEWTSTQVCHSEDLCLRTYGGAGWDTIANHVLAGDRHGGAPFGRKMFLGVRLVRLPK